MEILLKLKCLVLAAILMGFAFVFSENRKKIHAPTLVGAVVLAFVTAGAIFYLPGSLWFFRLMNQGVSRLLSFSNEGSYFLFGALALGPGSQALDGTTSLGFFLAFQVLPAVIFFSALMSLLYYLGLIQPVIRTLARVFRKFVRLSGAEALCGTSNIFVGIESVFMIRPFLEKLTRSELFFIMATMMSTVASTTLGLYVAFLQDLFPGIAGHLFSASLLSIPSAVLIAKIMIPETDSPVSRGELPKDSTVRADSLMEALQTGAGEGMKLAAGIASLLIAVIALTAFANFLLAKTWVILLPYPAPSLQDILSIFFIPVVYGLGIPQDQIMVSAQLLGERLILTEIFSYRHLAELIEQGVFTDARSVMILSYALCGFTHLASVAIFVGGLSAVVPKRAKEISQLGMKALFAAVLITLLTACLAGIFYRVDGLDLLNLPKG